MNACDFSTWLSIDCIPGAYESTAEFLRLPQEGRDKVWCMRLIQGRREGGGSAEPPSKLTIFMAIVTPYGWQKYFKSTIYPTYH